MRIPMRCSLLQLAFAERRARLTLSIGGRLPRPGFGRDRAPRPGPRGRAGPSAYASTTKVALRRHLSGGHIRLEWFAAAIGKGHSSVAWFARRRDRTAGSGGTMIKDKYGTTKSRSYSERARICRVCDLYQCSKPPKMTTLCTNQAQSQP